MWCRQGGLTARPYNVADAVLFLRERDQSELRALVVTASAVLRVRQGAGGYVEERLNELPAV